MSRRPGAGPITHPDNPDKATVAFLSTEAVIVGGAKLVEFMGENCPGVSY